MPRASSKTKCLSGSSFLKNFTSNGLWNISSTSLCLFTSDGRRHEHIYEQISDYVIPSDELPSDALGVSLLLKGVRVMLCTLSMLSNPVLQQLRVFKHVPVHRLVIDEASQISVFNYLVRGPLRYSD